MRQIALFAATFFLAALFVSGQAMAAETTEPAGQYGTSSGQYGTGMTTETPGAAASAQQLDESQVQELQMMLQEEGYQIGEISGEIDADTRSALMEFQRAEGLEVTGEPNENTLRSLATTPEEQEFFGLSPAFGEEEATEESVPSEESIPTEESVPMEQQQRQEPTTEGGQIQERPRAID